jgi:hypothetical protein
MHDGRAETVDEAVALHDGQGRRAARAYFLLAPEERDQVEAFLKSLVAPAWAAFSGVVPAAELEARLENQERNLPEAIVRRRRAEAEARDQARWREAQRRQSAMQAEERARARFPAAWNLERSGKISAALDYYTEIARDAPESEEGRRAAERIAALNPAPKAP